MIIWKEKDPLYNEDECHPIIVRWPEESQLSKEESQTQQNEYFKIPKHLREQMHWDTVSFTNFHFSWDFKEQIYKKQKSYFHISPTWTDKIDARTSFFRQNTPAAFFSKNIDTGIDFLSHARRKFGRYAYIHHCANVSSMNLFNTASTQDMSLLPVDIQNSTKSHPGLVKPHVRNWEVLEYPTYMEAVYGIRSFDGMALDYNNELSKLNITAEGVCLFDRAVKKMRVMRIAQIEVFELFDKNFDPRKYKWEFPNQIKKFNLFKENWPAPLAHSVRASVL